MLITKRGRTILSQAEQVHRVEESVHLHCTLPYGWMTLSQFLHNRGSIWVMTITIATPIKNYHTTYNTFVVSVVNMGADHTPMYYQVVADLPEDLVLDDNICV
jgi:hypothetical protein